MKRYTAHFFFVSAAVLVLSGIARFAMDDDRRGAFGVTAGIVWFCAGLYFRKQLKG